MKHSNLQNSESSLDRVAFKEYYTTNEIIELTDLSIHKVRRTIYKLAKIKTESQLHKQNGQWYILHSLLRYFSEKPIQKHYVLGTIAPQKQTNKTTLDALMEFYSTMHIFDIEYVVESNQNWKGNNQGFHIHFVTQKTNIPKMKKDLKKLITGSIDVRDIKFGEKERTLLYIRKEFPSKLIKV